MNEGYTFLGDFVLERESEGWRLNLKAMNGAQLHLYFPDKPDSFIHDVHNLHLHTFARNAMEVGKQWITRREGMESL